MPEKKFMQTETDGKKSFLQKETVDLQGKMFKNCTAKWRQQMFSRIL